MDDEKKIEIVNAWIACQEARSGTPQYEDNFWSAEALMKLPEDNPELAWELIISIYDRKPIQRVIENLAAGPFEDLVCANGENIINRIREKANKDPEFKIFMSYVWLDRSDTSVHDEFFDIAGCEPPFDE